MYSNLYSFIHLIAHNFHIKVSEVKQAVLLSLKSLSGSKQISGNYSGNSLTAVPVVYYADIVFLFFC